VRPITPLHQSALLRNSGTGLVLLVSWRQETIRHGGGAMGHVCKTFADVVLKTQSFTRGLETHELIKVAAIVDRIDLHFDPRHELFAQSPGGRCTAVGRRRVFVLTTMEACLCAARHP